MTDTKRVDELEVGDRVIFSGCKGLLTISKIEKIPEYIHYKIFCEGTDSSMTCPCYEKVTYLGNKREEETMAIPKVDCSALYPYFDSLANDELTFQHTNISVYVRQQLKNIHELFEGVLELTLEEVKTLYFERKMSTQKAEIKDSPKIKKVRELKEGDIFQYGKSTSTVSRVENEPTFDSVRMYFYQMGNPTTLPKDLEVVVLN